jgi:Zn-dependent membrane protease YugP
MAMPLFLIGFLFAGSMGILMDIGILLFVFAVLFQVITLPVEFNASSRAVGMLTTGGIIAPAEEAGVRKVLGAAALTYVAATATAISSLLRLFLLRGRRR